MTRPRFSIVIPTRNRHYTLKYSLLSCLNQNFSDYEIVVSDNYSTPETKKTVESLNSDKIKYVRSERPLAMSQNWELAISHTNGEFVTFIGDDDGLFPNALSKIDQILKILDVKALHWQWVYYSWPDSPTAKNRLIIPMARKNRILNWRRTILNVANKTGLYASELPMIYCSAIHRDLVDLLRQKTGGVFTTAFPDVYSGAAFAYLAQSYASFGLPLGIAGISAPSNGLCMTRLKNNPIAEEFTRLNIKANLRYHPKIPDVPVLSVMISDSIQSARDALFPDDKGIFINRKRLVLNCLTELRSRYISGADGEADWKIHLAKIRDSLADDLKLVRWFDNEFGNLSVNDVNIGWLDKLKRLDRKLLAPILSKSCCVEEYERGFRDKDIVLDGSDFGLENVFDVAEFCENFYSRDICGLEWHGLGIKPDSLIMARKMRRLLGSKLSNYLS